MNYAALTFWVLIAWSTTASSSTVLVLLLASMPFDGLALIPIEITGGLSILPQSMFAVVLIVKVLGPQVIVLSAKLLNATQLRSLGILTIFLLVGIAVTFIMPRLFQGEIVVIPMRLSSRPDILSPSAANFTQSAYLTLSVLTAFAVTLIAQEAGFTETFLAGLLVGGAVCVATGLIDMAAASTGTESWLEPFRNAGYAFLTEARPEGIRRSTSGRPYTRSLGVWSYLRPICGWDHAGTHPLY